MRQILCREFSQNKSVRSNSRKARRDWRRSLLPQKLLDFSENWHMYLSSAPRICAPTPVKRGPCTNLSRSLIPSRNSGFSTEYMKQKLCLHSGMVTLKYHPSKKGLAVPSKWYLQNDLAKLRYSSWGSWLLPLGGTMCPCNSTEDVKVTANDSITKKMHLWLKRG